MTTTPLRPTPRLAAPSALATARARRDLAAEARRLAERMRTGAESLAALACQVENGRLPAEQAQDRVGLVWAAVAGDVPALLRAAAALRR